MRGGGNGRCPERTMNLIFWLCKKGRRHVSRKRTWSNDFVGSNFCLDWILVLRWIEVESRVVGVERCDRLPGLFVDVDGYLGSVLWSWNFLPCNRFIVNIVEDNKYETKEVRLGLDFPCKVKLVAEFEVRFYDNLVLQFLILFWIKYSGILWWIVWKVCVDF